MKISNDFDLPEAFVGFAEADPYSKGDADFSVTELLDSPRISRLSALHHDEIVEDVSGMVPALLGTAIHTVLERGAPAGDIVEERLYIVVDGKIISGGIDLQEPDLDAVIISDYKTCSASALKWNPNGKPAWAEQLNLYATLVEANGKFCSGLNVVAILRDWMKVRADREPDYPQQSIVKVAVPLWDPEVRDELIRERVAAHTVEDLPLCSSEERWQKKLTYAVLQGNYKRAKHVASTMIEAETFAEQIPNSRIEERGGENVRCLNYCPVAEFCDQWKSIQKLGEKEDG